MVIDFLSDMVARLNNGYKAKLKSVKILNSKHNFQILQLLQRLGYISQVSVLNNRFLVVMLVYYRNQPAIRHITRISKVKHRIFLSAAGLFKRSAIAYGQNGFFIISTNKGLLTDIEAVGLNTGGELLFQII